MTAKQVGQVRVKQVAGSFTNQHARNASQFEPMVVYSHPMPERKGDAFYVVSIGENGFVIVAADDVAHPVLGYNFDHPWAFNETLPSQIAFFFDDLAAQIAAATEQEPDPEITMEWSRLMMGEHRPSASSQRDEVNPLLTTTWSQGIYYNGLCPMTGNTHALTGCVATAMAQIVNYYQFPSHGYHTHNYESENNGVLSVDFSNEYFDYDLMPVSLNESSTQEELHAVAQLMYDCGVAVDMQYGSDLSWSLNGEVRSAMVNFFGYDPGMCYVEKMAFPYADWDDLLRIDLRAGCPIYYGGASTSVGHAFVCDGFDADGFFHFNFGWGGNCDGWYLTSAINTEGGSFNSQQIAFIGIAPDGHSNTIYGQFLGNTTCMVDEPVDFYHLMGNNKYRNDNLLPGLLPGCNAQYTFLSADNTGQLVLDIEDYLKYAYFMYFYDGTTTDCLIRQFDPNYELDLSPIISTQHALTIVIRGDYHYDGFHFVISEDTGCRKVSKVDSKVDTTTVALSWTEYGDATQWEIEYGAVGFEHGEGATLVSDSCNGVIIEGLEPFSSYDLYVRSVCGEGGYGLWSAKVSFMTGGPYWKDVVTSQPEGYQVDQEGNVYISTAEGLAWLESVVDGYNAMSPNDLEGKTVFLTEDVDMQGFRWKPINGFKGNFDGQGHAIKHMCIVETHSSPYGANNIGMFSQIWSSGSILNDIHFRDVCVYAPDFYEVGALVGSLGRLNSDENGWIHVMNCSVTGTVEGNSPVGGLIGHVFRNAEIVNCMANCEVKGFMVAGVCGSANYSRLRNCYSASRVSGSNDYHYWGVLGAFDEYTVIQNCYSLYESTFSQVMGGGVGSEYLDNTGFILEDTVWRLISPIIFEQDTATVLLDALNACVAEINEPELRTWVKDTSAPNGLPVFGPKYEVVCPNINDLVAQNVFDAEENIGVALSWTETGEATTWEIRYHLKDSPDMNYVMTANNPDTLWGLTAMTQYLFSVRPVCDATHHGAWGKEVSLIVDRPYWTDVVTSRPEGFMIDRSGDITISSAEGLAWLISVVNGLNGETGNNCGGHSITVTQDLEMGRYKWIAMNGFAGLFDGGNHVIDGLYVNELDDYQGMFGKVDGGIYQNIKLNNAHVEGMFYAGGLIGEASNVDIINCHVSGYVYSEEYAGGVAAFLRSSLVESCSSNGMVQAKHHYAGGLIAETVWGTVRNSFSTCDVNIPGYSAGGLVGTCMETTIENCFATGAVNNLPGNGKWQYYGGLIGSFIADDFDHEPMLRNCYAAGRVKGTGHTLPVDAFEGAVTGSIRGHAKVSHCYGLADYQVHPLLGQEEESVYGDPSISDTASFVWVGDAIQMLDSVAVGGNYYSDMLTVLNAWVDANHAQGLYLHWVADTSLFNSGLPMLELTPVTAATQSVSFAQGWNWWSTFLEEKQTGALMGKQILDALIGTGEVIQAPGVYTINEGHGWTGAYMYSLSNEIYYQVKVSSPTEFVLYGSDALPSAHPISLQPGWNWMGYPLKVSTSIDDALEDLTPMKGDMVKSQKRFAVYHPDYGWCGTLDTLCPGEGYFYVSNNNTVTTFTYPHVVLGNSHVNEEDNHWVTDRHAYLSNMTVTAVVELDGAELWGEQYELAAFVGEECRGSVKLKKTGGRYFAFLTITGEGEDYVQELQFKLYDAVSGEEKTSNKHLDFNPNLIHGSMDQPVVIPFQGSSVEENDLEKIAVYPNPTDGLVTIETPRIHRLTVTNVLGQVVYDAAVNTDKARLDLSQYGVGMYLVRIQTTDGTIVKRIAVTE